MRFPTSKDVRACIFTKRCEICVALSPYGANGSEPGAWFVVITGNGEEPWASTDSKALPPPPPPFTSHWQAGGRREVLYGNYIKFFLFYTLYVGFGNISLSPNIYQICGANTEDGVVQISEKGKHWRCSGTNIREGLTKYLRRAHLPTWSRWLATPRRPHPVGFCTSR